MKSLKKRKSSLALTCASNFLFNKFKQKISIFRAELQYLEKRAVRQLHWDNYSVRTHKF